MFAERDRRMFAGLDLFVDADLLVHGAFVARQRHHLADGLKTDQHVVDARFDALNALADMGGDEFGLRYPKLGGEIALAHLWIFGARDSDFVRRRFHALVHVVTAYLLRMSLP